MCFDNCAHGIRVLVDADDAQHVALSEDNLLLLWLAGNEGADDGVGDHAGSLEGERVHAHVGSDGHDGRVVG